MHASLPTVLIRWRHNFAHFTTADLSWHVQNLWPDWISRIRIDCWAKGIIAIFQLIADKLLVECVAEDNIQINNSIMHTIQKQFHTASGKTWRGGSHNQTISKCWFCLDEFISVDIKIQSNTLITRLFFSKILTEPQNISLKVVGCSKVGSFFNVPDGTRWDKQCLFNKKCLALLL